METTSRRIPILCQEPAVKSRARANRQINRIMDILRAYLRKAGTVLRETYITAIKPRGAKAGPPDNKSESKVG